MNRVVSGGSFGICRWALVIAVAALLALFGHSSSLRADEPKPQVELTSVATDGWPVIQTTATVLDGSGQPISGLTREAFSARIGDTPIGISGFGTTSDPGRGIAVVLTFDTSGSMAGGPLDQAKSAGKALLGQLGTEDVAAIVSFSNDTVVVQDFTADRTPLSNAIDSLSATGNTALYSAVARSVELAQRAPSPRHAVVLLSDGYDFGAISGADPASTVTSVANGGGLFFTIGLGIDVDSQYLTQLAQAGHAQFLSAPTPDDLRALYVTAGNILRQQYVLTLDASQLTLAAGNAALRVDVSAGGAIGSGASQITVPAPANVPSASAVKTAPPVVQPAPVDEESSGSGLILAVGVAALIAAGATTGGVLLMRRRRTTAAGSEISIERLTRERAPMAFPEIIRATGPDEAPVWIEGPADRRTPLGDAPVTVGYSTDCSLYLGNGDGRLGRVRIWRRDGRYMLHNLSGGGHVTVGGKPVTWVILEDGDEIVVDGAALVFHDTQQ